MTTVISVENLSKVYHLGQIGTGTFSRDLEIWLARLRGKPNPHLKIGQVDHNNRDMEEIWALRNICFTVEKGEVLGIIGRNGAGKSTLLKILSRVTAPTSGCVRVKGRIASLLEVGTGFHPELTGRENIFLNGAILGMTKEEVRKKFAEIVDFAGIEKFIDTPVKRYSSGMYIRLAFAVAAHLEPEILLVDEVLAVGDAEFQNKCLGKMGDVAKEGRTVLFVSHNLAALESICSMGLLLDLGENIHLDFIGDTLKYYRNRLRKDLSNEKIIPQITDATIKLFDFVLKNNSDENSTVFQTGDSLSLTVTLIFLAPVRRAYVGISIFDELNRLIFAFNSMEAGLIIGRNCDLTDKTEISFQIPSLFLLPGRYYIKFYLVRGTGEILYSAPLLTEFIVEPKDIARSGHAYSKQHGLIFMPFELEIINPNQNEKVSLLLK